MSARCCIRASPHGRPRSRPPSMSAHPERRSWQVVAPGYEASIRIGLAVQPGHFKRGFQSTGTCDVFGTAAAAGRLLFGRRDGERLILASIGLAGSYSSGVAQFYYSGASGKRIQAAHAAQSGVAAALLTQQGFTGPADMIEGTGGFARAYADGLTPALIERGLGEAFSSWTCWSNRTRRPRGSPPASTPCWRCGRNSSLQRRRYRHDAPRHSPRDPGAPCTNPHSGRPAGSANVPEETSVALASTIPLAAGRIATLAVADYEAAHDRRLFEPRRSASRSRSTRSSGEQRPLYRSQGRRSAARRPRAVKTRDGAEKAAPAILSAGA